MPYADYYPGFGSPNFTDDQVAAIDQILAEETACKALPVIDPVDGVIPAVYPTGINRRVHCVIRLEVYYQPDRIKAAPNAVNRIADRIAREVVGCPTKVWMNIGSKKTRKQNKVGSFFEGRSDRPGAPSANS